MANFVLKELPGEMTDGKRVVFPKMQTYSMFDYDKVVEYMHTYAGAYSPGTIKGVLDALVYAMKSCLPLGHTLKIDGLGVFSLSLGFADEKTAASNGQETDEDKALTEYRHVKVKGVNFRPDPTLLEGLNEEATFERTATKTKTAKGSPYSREERLQRALQLIDRQGQLTLTDYVLLNGVSRTVASGDLKAFAANPASGITTRGTHSHKVWVRS